MFVGNVAPTCGVCSLLEYRGSPRVKIQSVTTIVLANLTTLVAALIQSWGMGQLLWPFWAQSVIIGLYAMRRLARASGRDLRYPMFFLVHYGGFHFGYLFLLLALADSANALGYVAVTKANTGELMQLYAGTQGPVDVLIYIGLAVAFWLGHRASFQQHIDADLSHDPGPGKLMILPYLRILPMHLTLIFGVLLGGPGTVVFFILLKTGADVALHYFEHRLLAGGIESSEAS